MRKKGAIKVSNLVKYVCNKFNFNCIEVIIIHLVRNTPVNNIILSNFITNNNTHLNTCFCYYLKVLQYFNLQ